MATVEMYNMCVQGWHVWRTSVVYVREGVCEREILMGD